MINVLIVEDDPMVAKFNRLYVEKVEGFAAAGVVHHVHDAWKLLEDEHIDLLLLDVYMKDVTGLDMLIELRKTDHPVDVIVITAANDKHSVQTALRYGAIDYLIKPFDFERLQESLLLYKKKYWLMNNKEAVSQEELDPLFISKEKPEKTKVNLPKGLTPITFARIANQIGMWNGQRFSAGDIAEKTGISRVSVRKYLQYLVEIEVLEEDVMYRSTGRPLHMYQIKKEKISVLQSLMAASEK
ncbi:two-component system, CitB family, response regulator/two-component system, CitB family, response regulator MalR [Alteribacillus persepolensis]|uniref:Two-component system, CitB family, response regulator/two-component system, CitB family, response regulator MalR n=1 Tax=Alteribacillus persepolensis TaxID=568899 RepID=A0A1G8AA22_9BACI|nr:response regulator [Alteribacillus persepolensis]SDH17739.1 two-component system, CitB family, response regulator/two-component system, CitB family, response regulator MalR [Alteribacillus persepolensis]